MLDSLDSKSTNIAVFYSCAMKHLPGSWTWEKGTCDIPAILVHLLASTICHLVHQWEGTDNGPLLTRYYLCGGSGGKESC